MTESEIAALKSQAASGQIENLVKLMALLRSPAGCPWDRQQCHLSLVPHLLEEAYEAVDALYSGDKNKICDELGDLLLQVIFHAQIGSENGEFTFSDVVRTITEKLIRRHPHIFAEAHASSAKDVEELWQAAKEGEAKGSSNHNQLPALLQLEKSVATGSIGADAVEDQLLGDLVRLVETAQESNRCLEAEVKKMLEPAES